VAQKPNDPPAGERPITRPAGRPAVGEQAAKLNPRTSSIAEEREFGAVCDQASGHRLSQGSERAGQDEDFS
jgi:hypothetical protein